MAPAELAITELVVASHIVPWSVDPQKRLNPRNGLCLNALHDRAFDKGLMWVEDDFVVRFSEEVITAPDPSDEGTQWLRRFHGQRLHLPRHFTPDPELLRRHRELCVRVG